MTPPSDLWYVRLPDGRVLQARSTRALRRHVGSGRIPLNSRARRYPDEEWVELERLHEFADLVRQPVKNGHTPPAAAEERPSGVLQRPGGRGIAAHLDSDRLQTVGARGLAEEVMAAVDCTMVRGKLVVAGLTGMVAGLAVLVTERLAAATPAPWTVLEWAGVVAAGLVLLAVCHAPLMQMTFVELSRLRPARRDEALDGFGRNAGRLAVAYLLTAGLLLLLIAGLRRLPGWLEQDVGLSLPAAAVNVVACAALLGEVVLWPVLISAFLSGAAIVVEDCSIGQGVRQWWRLLRDHYGRLLCFEALAAAAGVVISIPFALPVIVTTLGPRAAGSFDESLRSLLVVLGGLAAAPLIAYLAVANVFIYLYLRYEMAPRK